MFELMKLPYEREALAPYISGETIDYHYGKHHKTYVDKLNGLIAWTDFEGKSLEEIIITSKTGPIFNNAAQVWNHDFFWNSLASVKPWVENIPSNESILTQKIVEKWGWVAQFKEAFKNAALGLFGSGWLWLIQKGDGSLDIVGTSNAGNPLLTGENSLLVLDVWEHAYYVDYRNNRAGFIDGFWNIVDWTKVESRVQ